MSKVHRFELHVGEQVSTIPLGDSLEVVKPQTLLDKVRSGAGTLDLVETRANETQHVWGKIKHAVRPIRYSNGFICPVLLDNSDESLSFIAYDDSNRELFRRDFFGVAIRPDALYVYQAGPSDSTTTGGGSGGWFISHENVGRYMAYPSLKKGGPKLEDFFMQLVYAEEPRLLESKNQGPGNIVNGRFLVLKRVCLCMDMSLIGL